MLKVQISRQSCFPKLVVHNEEFYWIAFSCITCYQFSIEAHKYNLFRTDYGTAPGATVSPGAATAWSRVEPSMRNGVIFSKPLQKITNMRRVWVTRFRNIVQLSNLSINLCLQVQKYYLRRMLLNQSLINYQVRIRYEFNTKYRHSK